ncbi:MAG: glutamate--tRNA ligase [Actinobacteria bacterium]|jgi:glutamyl-tRNA synthetase|nr:glutamate--tRNA ligase [Actinomycetota bacterium]MCB9415615.1 glutamate--tRNA ligase [Actinomycetota bacterium]MCB9425328.1 glutamate--tRNA ligase [Actinomycetota bacterium]
MNDVRVRFCPSPTGNPHVGMVRTALFNWAYARHTGGTFVFRIEDTDSARDSEESYQALVDTLRWLHLDWDEGPEVGGPYAPYRQSQRLDVYTRAAARLLDEGKAYRCYCTPEELEAQRDQARKENRAPGYEGTCRNLTSEQIAAYEAEGRSSVVRVRMPDHEWQWNDLVRGDITIAADQVPDFVIVRANGEPLYTLVNPVDDIEMRISHVLRGEDLLSSTPRQLAMYEHLGAPVPQFGHLPYVMGEGNKKLSKRDPQSNFNTYVEQGYLPEAMANYLALLGWSIGGDQEFFSLTEMAEHFDVKDVNASPARFDLKKCTAINGDWIRALDVEDLASRMIPFLQRDGILPAEVSEEQHALLLAATPLVQERMETLGQSGGMLGFLFAGEEFTVDAEDAEKILTEQGHEVVRTAAEALQDLPDFAAEPIQQALREALVDGMGIKPKLAFGPVRVAITGRRVSPPLFESMELLGRDESLRRLRSVLAD